MGCKGESQGSAATEAGIEGQSLKDGSVPEMDTVEHAYCRYRLLHCYAGR